ncbi:MAG: M23 family metallopeptidase [Spirochaetia bacterium]|nr:M23 family metallopeptidase [Spirochaetia bacterium]
MAGLTAFPVVPSGRGHISVAVDNEHIQSYRGLIGRWVNTSGETARSLAARFGTTPEKVLEVNDGALRNQYAFVPMGQTVYRAILQSGKGRRILELDPRKLLWPVEVPNYTSRFGQRWGQLHTGLDMACAAGTVVVASADGVVVASGWQGGLGQAVALQHDDGTQTWYAHNSVLLLKAGEKVKRGQIVALAGATGRATGPHVHMEVRFMDVFLNPEDFIQYGLISPETVLREVPPMESSDVAQRSDVPAAAPVRGN